MSERKKESLGTEAESKEKYGVWDPMPESPYVHAMGVDVNTFTLGIFLGNPMPESTLTLCHSRSSRP
jgi:hypothetical protein